MKFTFNDYELDSEKLYLDMRNEVVKLGFDGDELLYRLEGESNWHVIEGVYDKTYVQQLREVSFSAVHKIKTREKGKAYAFFDDDPDESIIGVFTHTYEGYYYTDNGEGYRNCEPIPKDVWDSLRGE
jgi:hypothetical protein